MGNLAETLLLFVPREALAEALYHSLGRGALSAKDALVMIDHYRVTEDEPEKLDAELARLLQRLDRRYSDQLREMWGPEPGERGEAVLASFERASGCVRDFMALIGGEKIQADGDPC